jgi:cell division protein FtsA
MKLPFFGKKQPKLPEILLALDIGTEYVKAVLFTLDEDTFKINIKGFGKSRQHSNAMQGAMIVNIDYVVSAADRAIGEALHQADLVLADTLIESADKKAKTPLPNRVILGIAGELVQGVSILAEYEREDPSSKITKEEKDEVISNVREQAFDDALIDISEELGLDQSTLREINTKINSTYIDGIKVDDPLGFTGKDVIYKVYSTFAPKIHINSLKEIAKQLGLEIVSIEVEPYAISRAIKGARSAEYSAVIIDIGGGTTDIALIDKGAVIGTKMFAYGGRVFTKRLAHDLKVELEEAERLKLAYGQEDLPKDQTIMIRKSLVKDIRIWSESVELSLAEMSEDIEMYPNNIYICGGGSALPEIKTALMEYPWLQTLPFVKYPKTDFLYPNQLADIVDETESLHSPEDVAPIALARMILEKV